MSRNHLSFISKFFFFLLVASAIVGCGNVSNAQSTVATTPTTQPSAPPLTKVDWNNFTYTSSCYSDKPRQFVVKNGEGAIDGTHLQVYKPVYGDLTGNGQLEAAVPYSCFAADSSGVRVFVYSGNAKKPVLLGELVLMSPGAGMEGSVDSVTINNGIIQLTGKGYSPTAPHCCPDLRIKTSYHWNGSRFVIVSSQVTRL